MITEIEDYFTDGCGRCARFATPDCSARQWAAGLKALRHLCRDAALRQAGLAESVKWGHPCYHLGPRNIAILGAFRGDFRLTFFNAALLIDPAGLLERQGPGSRAPDTIRLTDPAGVVERAAGILDLLRQAMGHAAAGTLPPKDDRPANWPDELTEALDADPELAEAFHRLTPGRQKSHVLHLTTTANPATRFARIDRLRPKILAGKGATER